MRNTILLVVLLPFISCGGRQARSNEISHMDSINTTPASDAVTTTPPAEKVYDIPVTYKNWRLGDHESTRVILKLYKAWDSKSVQDMSALFADTVVLDLPHGKRRIAPKDKLISRMLWERKGYLSTSNNVIAAIPVYNIDKGEEWVTVLVYNKWTYKDKTRDSMLYQDLWKVRDGKVNYLLTLEQTPSPRSAKQLDQMVKGASE